MTRTFAEPQEMVEHVNFWGECVVHPQTVIRDHLLAGPIRSGMVRILREFTLSEEVVQTLIQQIEGISTTDSPTEFDRDLRKLLFGKCDEKKVRASLDMRASHVARQIEPFLVGNSFLDIGTGDGVVAWNVRRHFNRHSLVDVIDYVDPRVTLPFQLYDDGANIPAGNRSHDTAILTNVLHHSVNPLHLLEDSWRVTKRRLIIIESVYADMARAGETGVPFCLSERDQFIYTSFFDWFYNRVLHCDVPVPFNYLSPQAWEQTFTDRDMSVAFRQDLGIDVEIVPIHHFLYVLEKR